MRNKNQREGWWRHIRGSALAHYFRKGNPVCEELLPVWDRGFLWVKIFPKFPIKKMCEKCIKIKISIEEKRRKRESKV